MIPIVRLRGWEDSWSHGTGPSVSTGRPVARRSLFPGRHRDREWRKARAAARSRCPEIQDPPALLEAALRRLAGFLAPALDLTELRLEDGAGTWRACLRARVRRGEDWSDDPIEVWMDLPRSSHGDARQGSRGILLAVAGAVGELVERAGLGARAFTRGRRPARDQAEEGEREDEGASSAGAGLRA